MALIDQINTANDQTFKNRVAMAVLIAAKDVAGEVKDPGTTDAQEAKRLALANQIVTSGLINLDHWARLVTTNLTITLESTDGDIQFTVNSLWDDVSGASSIQ